MQVAGEVVMDPVQERSILIFQLAQLNLIFINAKFDFSLILGHDGQLVVLDSAEISQEPVLGLSTCSPLMRITFAVIHSGSVVASGWLRQSPLWHHPPP